MKRILLLAALFVAGCAAALSLGVTRASAYTVDDLAANGFNATEVAQQGHAGCPEVFVLGHGSPYTDLGATCDQGFQAALDGFMSAWCPCAQTTATTTAAATTTPAVSTTSTTSTSTPPTSTDTTTTAVTTPAQTATPTITTVGTTTVVVTAPLSPVEQSLSDQVAALAAEIAVLTDRVSVLEKAGDAAWLAFQQATAEGADDATAAAIARGTYLNAVNGLGQFAP